MTKTLLDTKADLEAKLAEATDSVIKSALKAELKRVTAKLAKNGSRKAIVMFGAEVSIGDPVFTAGRLESHRSWNDTLQRYESKGVVPPQVRKLTVQAISPDGSQIATYIGDRPDRKSDGYCASLNDLERHLREDSAKRVERAEEIVLEAQRDLAKAKERLAYAQTLNLSEPAKEPATA